MQSLTRTFALATALGLSFAIGGAAPAWASLFCELKETKDGFVALRDGPSATARLLHRMRTADEVMLDQGRTGPWVKVVYWRGGRFASGTNPAGDPPTGRGWMHSGLLKEDSCG